MTHVNIVTPRREDGSPSNWDRFLDLMIRRQVPAKVRPWTVRRVQDFPQDLNPVALSALAPDQVTDYLRRMSARSDLADWQMRQIVDALRLLGTFKNSPLPAIAVESYESDTTITGERNHGPAPLLRHREPVEEREQDGRPPGAPRRLIPWESFPPLAGPGA